MGAGALLLAAALAARAQAPDSVRPDPAASPALKAALAETARELRKTETGRRLLALTDGLRLVERPYRPGPALRYVGGDAPALLVDSERAPTLSPLEFELSSVRERWRAAAALPAEVLDGEWAARQAVLEHALEKTDVDPAFAAELKTATTKARASLESRRKQADWARKNGGTGETMFPGAAPAGELDRLAYDLYLYSEDPGLFFASAVRSGTAVPEAPTYDEALEFLERHEEGLGRVSWPAGGWAELDGRWYKAGPARVAKDLGRDGLRRLAERLGPYRAAGRTALLKKVNAWLRAAP
ncbi:hypothetical protein EPO15_07640 [bacterium]|nr:MAG: hypothetical protein EPO15_07640 [bacterium]